MIYLDNAATTKVHAKYKNIIDTFLYDEFGNPNSLHEMADRPHMAVENARQQIAAAVGAEPEDVIFTSGGSEANTLAILGMERTLRETGRMHLVTTMYEHHSVLNAFKEMERRGFSVTYLKPNRYGFIGKHQFEGALRSNTGLASVMYVNNEIGSFNEIESFREACVRRGILFHSDCVQALGTFHFRIGVSADVISLSGHKIHAPKGVGCLITKRRFALNNIIFGGEQEFSLRPGTENVPYIAAFGEAVKDVTENFGPHARHIDALIHKFWDEVDKGEKKYNVRCRFNSNPYGKIASLTFPGVDAQTLVMYLSGNGICVSAGAACSSHQTEPSHVLKAIGLSDEDAMSTIRVSFSEDNTEEEVVQAAEEIMKAAEILKNAN